MRVLMLTAHSSIGGPLPKLAPILAAEMRRLGCQVETLGWSRRRENESVLERLVSRPHDLLRCLWRLCRQSYDVMYVATTHDWPALLRDVPLLALSRRSGMARLVHFHGSMVDRLSSPGHLLMKASSHWLVRHCDAVLLLSREEQERWSNFCPAARFEVVENPFAAPEGAVSPLHRASKRPMLLFIGRLIPEKGVLDLIEALHLMPASARCSLRIAGRGACEAVIRRRVAELGLGPLVELVGYVGGEELAVLYRSSDVLVLPTYFGEGFPTVISEAMSYGLPIVTTRIRGAADHLVEGENALFVPPRDPAALARVLLELVNDAELRARMGERNREKVRQFSPDCVVPRYVEIMASVLAPSKVSYAATD